MGESILSQAQNELFSQWVIPTSTRSPTASITGRRFSPKRSKANRRQPRIRCQQHQRAAKPQPTRSKGTGQNSRSGLRCPTKERPPSPMNNPRRASEHDREHTCNHPNPEERSSRKRKEDNREAVKPTKVNLNITHSRIREHNGMQHIARNHGPATNTIITYKNYTPV